MPARYKLPPHWMLLAIALLFTATLYGQLFGWPAGDRTIRRLQLDRAVYVCGQLNDLRGVLRSYVNIRLTQTRKDLIEQSRAGEIDAAHLAMYLEGLARERRRVGLVFAPKSCKREDLVPTGGNK
jgi:hypothetical protein